MKRAALAMISAAVICGCASNPPRTASSSLKRDHATNAAKITAGMLGGYVYNVANTQSMLPTFGANAVLVSEAVAFDSLKAGDIVVYQSSSGELITHRLTEKQGLSWIAKGDNNTQIDDERVTSRNLVSRVVAIFYCRD